MFPWDRKRTVPVKMGAVTARSCTGATASNVIVTATTLLSSILSPRSSEIDDNLSSLPAAVITYNSATSPAAGSSSSRPVTLSPSAVIDLSSPSRPNIVSSPTSSLGSPLGRSTPQPPASPSSQQNKNSMVDTIFTTCILSSLLSPLKTLSPKRKLNFDNPPCESSASVACNSSTITTKISPTAKDDNINDSDSSDVSILQSPIKKKKLKLRNCERFRCMYVTKKGSRKGMRCEKYAKTEHNFCTTHSKYQSKKCLTAKPTILKGKGPESVITKVKTESKKAMKIKINRLKLNEKYYVIQTSTQPFNTALIKSNNQYYRVKIPQNMSIPEGENIYLIREKLTKVTEWRKNDVLKHV